MAGESLPARIAESTGTVFYVDNTTGSDAYTESQAQSESTPWATIQHALNTITPQNHTGGPKVKVRATGVPYQEAIEWAPGSSRQADATHILTVEGYGGRPQLKPPVSSPPDWMIHVYKSGSYYGSHIRFRNLELLDFVQTSGGGIVGMYADASAQYIELDQIYAHNIGPLGSTGRATWLFGGAGTDHIQLWNSVLCDVDPSAVGQAGLSHCIYMEGDDFYAVNSLMHHAANGHGIQLYSGSANAANHGLYHVTSVDNAMSGLIVLHRYTNVQIRNAILAFNGTYGIHGYPEGSPAGTGQTADRVILHGNTSGPSYVQGASPLVIQNQLTGDPLFVNRAGRDYRLQSGSPARSFSDSAFSPTTDLVGTVRG